MIETLPVRRVAEITGLTAHTLRYYEEAGLLDPVDRAANGHRRYSAEEVEQIRFLACLRGVGMPIRSMRQYADLWREGPHTVGKRRELLEQYRVEVKKNIEELGRSLTMIEDKIEIYEQMEARDDDITSKA